MGRIAWYGQKTTQRSSCKLAANIGGQLLKARQHQQLTMRQVADSTGLSSSFICEIENSQSIPTAMTLWKLSQSLGVPIGYWFRGYSGEQ